MSENDNYVEIAGGSIRLWTASGTSIHLKALTDFGDPVEINAEEARELAEALLKLIAEIE